MGQRDVASVVVDNRNEIHQFLASRRAGITPEQAGLPVYGANRRVPGLRARPRAVVLVEGSSDQVALEAIAERRGRDLAAEGIAVVPMGGARNIRHFLEQFGPRGLAVRLAGLCDAGEEGDVRRGLEWAGLGSILGRAEMEALGFYVCVADLEDELIRGLGAAAVEQVVEAQGELGIVPHLPAAACLARTPQPGAAPALPRHPQRPQDPLRPAAGRRAGSHERAPAAGSCPGACLTHRRYSTDRLTGCRRGWPPLRSTT